ncbi:MAG TPA: pyruvate dehydrogenase complex dihydrolipoamide acetyltransferase [Alphaproteobacteria bacterium]|nr:pyruvate dehydrogenase complex dihydrolipoamide acetyltransferase [Alphaproteobacteria bacterium]
MPIQILMPALSPTMTEGNLAKWAKKEGDMVKPGEVIAEIETDKATMEVEAVDEGKLAKILVPAGTQGVKVNQVIAVLLSEGEKELPAGFTANQNQGGSATKGLSGSENKTADNSAAQTPSRSDASMPSSTHGPRIFASPLAKRMAEQAGIDLKRVTGSGPSGRIVKEDIERAKSSGLGPQALLPQGIDAIDYANKLGQAYELVPNSATRKIIAKRLTEAKQTVPHFYLTVDCRIDRLLELRKQLNETIEDAKISVNDFVMKAVAIALRQVPAANASWAEAGILLYKNVDISMAVATPNGLITPIVKNADVKSIQQLSVEAKALAAKARENKLKPEEFQGGGFTVSNLGMYGIKEFAAIINPPQGCILAVGAGEERPVVKNGDLAVATVMTCTLSVDHRVVDGAVGAEFLAAFKKLIEEPIRLFA